MSANRELLMLIPSCKCSPLAWVLDVSHEVVRSVSQSHLGYSKGLCQSCNPVLLLHKDLENSMRRGRCGIDICGVLCAAAVASD